MSNATTGASSKRILEPIERISEVLFGLIMVLTFTGSLSAAESGRADVRVMLIGALGSNLAWGLIDAIMYLMAFRNGGQACERWPQFVERRPRMNPACDRPRTPAGLGFRPDTLGPSEDSRRPRAGRIAGVGSGTVDCTEFRFHPRFYTERANVCVSCAGFVAERMTVEDPAIAADIQQSDDDLKEVIERFLCRHYEPELWAECGDAGNAFARILSRVPEPLEAIALYRQYEQETKMILARSDVWAGVQLVAAKLLDQGRLSGLSR